MITILMLSVDESERLEHSLPAALSQQAEVLVIDNGCSDGTAELAQRLGARVLRLARRVSYSAAINAGLAQAGGDAVLLLNADCVLAEGFLAAAAGALEDPTVGSVAPKLLQASGMAADRRSGRIDAAGMVIDRRRKNTLVGHGEPAQAYAVPGEAFGGDGAAVLYRRQTLEDCALGAEVLDEDLELWAADVDLAWRARTLGWRCRYEPRALAWHVRFYSPSTRAEVPERHRRLQFRNRYLMIAKNDTALALARDLPFVLAYELAALGHVLLRERHLLGGYRDAARLWSAARRRRALLRPRRRARQARAGPPPVRFGLRPPR